MKKLIALVLAVGMCFSLVSCGNGQNGDGVARKDGNYSEENKGFYREDDVVQEKAEELKAENMTEESPVQGENGGAIRPEFKEALDSYEMFFDEYCEFMETCSNNLSDLNIITEYTDFMIRYADTMEKMEALDDGTMNDAETAYYIEVTTRISQKLLETSMSLG